MRLEIVVIQLFGSIIIVLGSSATPRISPQDCPKICWDDVNFICNPSCFSITEQWAKNPKKVQFREAALFASKAKINVS